MQAMNVLESMIDDYDRLDSQYMDLIRKSSRLNYQLSQVSEQLKTTRDELYNLREKSIDHARYIGLEKKTDFTKIRSDFPDFLRDRIENVRRIRSRLSLIEIDGKDLDIPDIYMPLMSSEPCDCYPCDIYKELQMILDDIKPELSEVLRIKYGVPICEKNMSGPGWVTRQDYMAKQLNVSDSTISRRLTQARKILRHPETLVRLKSLLKLFDPSSPSCSAEFLVIDILRAS